MSMKSNSQPHYLSVQMINQTKNSPGFGDFKKAKTVFKLRVAIYQFIAKVIAAILFSSCQKELSDPVLNSTTLTAFASATAAPTVDAGPVKRIVYPDATLTTLSGSGSSSGITFKWTQISGNSTATIAKPTSLTTSVGGLKPGVYKFALTVTDTSGISRKDTTAVTVYKKMTWTIEGITREALVHPPSGTGPAPVIFAFHGHGGTDLGFSLQNVFEVNWPEASVVYPQGLRTKSRNDPYAKESGWQQSVGEINSVTGVKDQDLKLFDAILSTFKNIYNVNSSQIFAHGWSNGGEFVYNALWTTRGSKLAALAPAAATVGTTSGKTGLPVVHTAGKYDPVVSFSIQQKTVQAIRTLDQCSSTGTKWASGPNGLLGTHYSSSIDDPIVFLQYDGSHTYPATVPPLVVKFFKQLAAGTIH
jgi:predicted esterase